jgi:hypothetical protein
MCVVIVGETTNAIVIYTRRKKETNKPFRTSIYYLKSLSVFTCCPHNSFLIFHGTLPFRYYI